METDIPCIGYYVRLEERSIRGQLIVQKRRFETGEDVLCCHVF